MEFIIRQILIAFTLILVIHGSMCDYEFQKYRLSRVLENLIESNSKKYYDEDENEIGRAYDVDCVQNFFKLPQNSNLMVHMVEEMIFTAAAGMKCSDDDKVFENYLNEYCRKSSKVPLSCVKWQLQQLEPNSKLIENFKISETGIEECKKIMPTGELSEIQHYFESKLGPLKTYTCGAVSENGADDFFKFYCKGVLIKYGDSSEELKKSEKEKLKEYFKDISIRTVNCITKRFEDDPQAYVINETLTAYYKNELEPIDSEQFDPNNYYKRLTKIKETINYDCVKEKLKLPQNGDKAISGAEARILIAAAKSKCIKVDSLKFSNLFIEFITEEHDFFDIYFTCAKFKLQELEPTSKLAVISSSEQFDKDRCDYYDINFQPYSVPTWTYKEQIGRLNETTCGVVTDEFEDLISVKTLLIHNEKDEELKINETKQLFDLITGKLQKLSDCILGRIK